eukprot:COSAG02_NODE_69343_length_198_cov_159.666667_1_plen_22_part_01
MRGPYARGVVIYRRENACGLQA